VSGNVPAAGLGAMLGAVAALTAVAASYLVVEATDGAGGGLGRYGTLWSLPVVQVVVPIAATAPVALALQSML
jgi:hypothetical protein